MNTKTIELFTKAFAAFSIYDKAEIVGFIEQFNANLHNAHGENDTVDGEFVLESIADAGTTFAYFVDETVSQAIGGATGLVDLGIPHQIYDHVPTDCEFTITKESNYAVCTVDSDYNEDWYIVKSHLDLAAMNEEQLFATLKNHILINDEDKFYVLNISDTSETNTIHLNANEDDYTYLTSKDGYKRFAIHSAHTNTIFVQNKALDTLEYDDLTECDFITPDDVKALANHPAFKEAIAAYEASNSIHE